MIGTTNCIYETPCGWCSKWDKECDKKIPKEGQETKGEPVDDVAEVSSKTEAVFNKICVGESDHEWEWRGISTLGTGYRCKKCGAHKSVECHPVSITCHINDPYGYPDGSIHMEQSHFKR